MIPSNIAWTVCMILWLICFTLGRKFEKENDLGAAGFFLALEWLFLGFSIIFLGLSRGWW